MPRAGEVRLARLETGREQAGAQGRRYRAGLRATANVCTILREAAQAAGIDPAEIWALRRGEEAVAELAALGDTPKLQRADEAAGNTDARRGEADPHGALASELSRLARRYTDKSAPDPVNSSLAEWFSWALAPPRPGEPKSPTDSPSVDGRRLSGGRRHASRKSR